MLYNIEDFGAAAGTVCTDAIQAAIDKCSHGGVVYIPKGKFITGALFLKSNMTLRLDDGAVLYGSGRIEDFPIVGCPYEGTEQLCYASLINTNSSPHENITIEGGGVIDANGRAVFDEELANVKNAKRGRAVCIRNTDGLTITGVTIRQSPAWCVHIIYCNNVVIDNVKVHSKYDEDGREYGMHNCDGIDIDSCQNVTVKDSLIASQDDCIAVKSGKNEEGRRIGIPSKDITIENCVFKSGFGVAMGSEMSGGVENVYVKNCEFTDTFSIASIKPPRGRGAYIKNIHYENCSIDNRNTKITPTKWFKGAIYLDGFYGEDGFDEDMPQEINDGTSVVDGVYFKNITIKTVTGHAVYMCGLPEMPFKNVYMENVSGSGEYGMKIKHIDNLKMENVNIEGKNAD